MSFSTLKIQVSWHEMYKGVKELIKCVPAVSKKNQGYKIGVTEYLNPGNILIMMMQ